MVRTYSGRIPPAEDGWQLIESVKDNGQEWMVFQKPQTHSQEWKNYKVVVKGRAKKKQTIGLQEITRLESLLFLLIM